MKVLFAVNNDEISNEVIKRYQKDYKEILSYKNVYYFNAILKELQRDKTYDRVVISEDLEPFANNNYDTIDKFLFEKLDNISDETSKTNGETAEIIFICSDRRNKADEMLNKLFGIGIYSAIIGQDRSIEEVCKLINNPRTKKAAKQYYKIESDSVNYQVESEDSVSEIEVQNILAHYKRLGKNEDKYVESFNSIVPQYTDAQLKIIIRYLPISVKAVLEARSPKYQQLVEFDANSVLSNKVTTSYGQPKKKDSVKLKPVKENKPNKINISKPIVIPTGLNKTKVKKLIKQEKQLDNFEENETVSIDNLNLENVNNVKKIETVQDNNIISQPEEKRGRGRPRKNPLPTEEVIQQPKRGRGRPRKNVEVEEDIDLFNIGNDEQEQSISNRNDDFNEEELNLSELYEEQENEEESLAEDVDLFSMGDEDNSNDEKEIFAYSEPNEMLETQYKPISNQPSMLITKDKKIVTFVGTTKNGTTFIVNNVAHMLASIGIKTAILDMTKTKNDYYIYTDSRQNLIDIAKKSVSKLKSGIAEGLSINKNLDVYVPVPDDQSDYNDAESILSTLVNNYSVILIDCDFNTNMRYFDLSQEIYLVQSMDVLTMQPLTAFLRDMQSKGILKEEKIKIVINKAVNLRSVPIKTLIGGISTYSDPSLTIMKTLFNKDTVKYCVIPFELQNYIKYLDSVINCKISLNGYTKPLMDNLTGLCNMVYPLINNKYSSTQNINSFSSNMNDTLDKMKKKYK